MQLMLLMGPTLPVPVPAPLTDALRSAQVTTAASSASGFQLTFAVSSRSVIQLALLPAGFFDPPTRVVLVAIVAGTPTVLCDGVITRLQLTPSDEPGASTLTVTGEDLLVLMSLEHRRVSYSAMPREVRVETILARYAVYGIIPQAVTPVLPDIVSPTQEISAQAGTDLDYIRGLASDVGHVFYLQPGPVPGVSAAYWGPEVRIGIPQPALTLGMGAATNVESLSLTVDGLSRTTYSITIVNDATRIAATVPLPDVTLLRPPLAARPIPALRTEPLGNVADRSASEVALLALSRTAQADDAVTGEGTLDVLRYGQVLQARQLVGVRGVGLAYDGLYYVTRVTHDIKRGEYKQSFSLARDGLVSLTPAVLP